MLRGKSIKGLSFKFAIALLTFTTGVALTGIWFAYRHSAINPANHQVLSASQAKEIIENSGIFSYPKHRLLRLTTSDFPLFTNIDDPLFGILSDLGLIEITQTKTRSYRVQITEKGRAQNWAYGENDWDHLPEARMIPIASRDLVALESIRYAAQDTCEVLVVWRWRANEIGEKLNVDDSFHECVIELKRRGSEWYVPEEDASKRLRASENHPLVAGNQSTASAVASGLLLSQTSLRLKKRDLETVEAACYKEKLNNLALTLPLLTYPPEAARKKIGGKVTVKVFIDEHGEVYYALPVDGPSLLRKAALRSARKATFAPFTKDDSPIKCSGNLVYTFNAPK